MKWSAWKTAIAKKWHLFFRTLVAPVLRRTGSLFLRWSAVSPAPTEDPAAWKQQALEDFSAWLVSLPALEKDREPEPQSCDLFTLLLEFTALRQEIKLQGRQQRTTLRSQEGVSERLETIAAQFDERLARFDRIHDENWRHAIEDTAVLPFLDIRDALRRGLAASRAVAETRSFWRRPPKTIHAVVEGYAMALRRFDRSLDHLGIKAIDAADLPFDASCMRAVDKRIQPDREPGVVLEVISCGFSRSGKILRTAEVVVNSQ